MSLITRNRASARRLKARASAGAAGTRARAARQSREAAAQVAPLATNVRATTQRRLHDARVWTAPRLERTGHAVQERAAPRVAAMLSAAARRIEPSRPQPARRWPALLAGCGVLACGGAAVAVLVKRRISDQAGHLGGHGESEPSVPQREPADAGATPTDINRHARTT